MKLLSYKFISPTLIASAKAKLNKAELEVYLNKYSYSIPILMDSDGEVIREAHSFLLEKEVYSRSINRTKTVDTYSESLLDWFAYCNSTQANWKLASSRALISYRNTMKNSRKERAKTLSASTINLRMSVVVEFLKHYLGELLQANPGQEATVRQLQKITTGKFSVRGNPANPIALSAIECQKLNARLKHPHKLIFAWGVSTGLRIGTILSINLDTYSGIKDLRSGGFVEVKTKGGRRQKIFVPPHIINLTNQYVDVERKLALLRGQKKISTSDVEMLFVNNQATAVSYQCYYHAYKRACNFLQISSHPHQARTTFATFIEKSLRAYGVANGIDHVKIVQGLLGHASAETTVGYLEGLRVNDGDVLAILERNSEVLGGLHG